MTPAQLQAATGCTPERAAAWLPHIEAACAEWGIDTPGRQAAFLAQIGHESGGLRYVVEVWGPTPAQLTYEGRKGLGNTEPGDGSRYRGRGLIQITGRSNYEQVTRALGVDFVDTPEALQTPEHAARSAAWFWSSRNLNALADTVDLVGFEAITKKINGGLNGQTDRLRLYRAACKAFGLDTTGQPALQPAMPTPIADLSKLTPTPNPTPTPTGDANMPPFVLTALASVLDAAPKLIGLFGGGTEVAERNATAAQIAVNIAKQATGATNEQDLVEKIKADPEAAAAVRQAIEANWFTITTNMVDIEKAREVNANSHEFWKQPAIWVTLMLMPLLYFVVYRVLTTDTFSSEVQSMVISGVVTGVLGSIVGFWFGTSFSSSRKTELQGK